MITTKTKKEPGREIHKREERKNTEENQQKTRQLKNEGETFSWF